MGNIPIDKNGKHKNCPRKLLDKILNEVDDFERS